MHRLILGKIVFIFMFFSLSLFASVSAIISTNTATKGEVVILELNAYGQTIEFPNIQDIAGEAIVGTSRSSSLQIINGQYNKDETVQYHFVARENLEIPSYEITVDGNKLKTEKISLSVQSPSASKAGDDYQLKIYTDKSEAYIGETIKVTLEFKYKENKQVLNLAMEEFKQKGLWIKSLPEGKPFKKDGYVHVEKEYVVFPQATNLDQINNQFVEVTYRDFKTKFTKRKKVYSNDLKLNVKPLPVGIDVQGEFKIEASVDKTTVDANKPVNLTIKVEGLGNIDDIDSFKLALKDEVVYDTKPQIKTYIQGGKYGGVFTQKLSIVADKDFTIPSIKLKYFDIKTKSVKVVDTNAIKISVNRAKVSEATPQIQTNQQQVVQLPPKVIIQKEDSYLKYLFAFLGVFVGALGVYLIQRKSTKVKTERAIDIQIKKAKNHKQLYEVLLPYSNQVELKKIMQDIEENIYNNGKNKINKKEIIKKVSID